MKKTFSMLLVLALAPAMGCAPAAAAGESQLEVTLPVGTEYSVMKESYADHGSIAAADPAVTHIVSPEEAPPDWGVDISICDDLGPEGGYPAPEEGYALTVRYSPAVLARIEEASMPAWLDDLGAWGGYDPSCTFDFLFTLPVPEGYDGASARYYDHGYVPVEGAGDGMVSIRMPMIVYSSSAAGGYIMDYADDRGMAEETFGVVVEYKKAAAPVIVSEGVSPKESGTAIASAQSVNVDGAGVDFQMYALQDGTGATNYIKLRDLAAVLNGTRAQFSVGWDNEAKTISLTTGEAYTLTGTEGTTPYTGDRDYTVSRSPVVVNGWTVELQAFILTDDAGSGYTYFKLRDLAQALGFHVGWSAERGVYVDTGVGYGS